MAKSGRVKIRLNSTGVKENGQSTGHFYTCTKNPKTAQGKMEIKKYDPVIRKHVIYKEGKIK